MKPDQIFNSDLVAADVVYSEGGYSMGKEHMDRAIAIINNGLDQDVDVQIQGRGFYATNWQDTDAADTTVAAGANGFILVDAPWYEVRAEVTPDGVPTEGTLIIELCKAFT